MKLEIARSLGQPGVVDIINYQTHPQRDYQALHLTHGRGAHVVVENVGPTTIAQSLRSLARRGTVSQVGFLGGFNVDHFLDTIGPSLAKSAVIRCVLEALNSLHEGGYVHADVKPDNVFVNYIDRGAENDVRFSEVQLGDLGGTCHVDSKWAKSGTPLGAPMWRSPEMIMETPWGTPTDIWSFGTMLISLIYGGDFNLFDPTTVPYGHEEYSLEVLKQQFRYFGPWPGKYEEVASPETVHAIMWIMQEIPKSETTPFSMITEKEVCKKDREFIMGIMKMDWRDRPTPKDLLGHKWFNEDCEE
ncbi:uncharacterized protein CDV56_102278 [Aspergillus thermomutatus]|uniref:Protein kinase domain-containing protein n=1 Tax=Aspergillus thermomutatus TaxID=41047 RepID=A0A397GWN4_ASPTH|nr:uncharacterized protein CDV56_102278 [Aspergillus thermomutatus]RHZ55402.1 hypothetical protein CDV56_102278 [Aspergillus thermomutatus]